MIEDIALTHDQSTFAETAEKSFAACVNLAPQEIAAQLAADGLLGMMAAESSGGLGLGASAAWMVTRTAGTALLAYPLAEAIAAAWCATQSGRSDVTSFVDGSAIVTVCWDADIVCEQDGDWLVSGVAPRVPSALVADHLVYGSPEGIFIVDLAAAGVSIQSAIELDLERPYGDVVLENASATLIGTPEDADAFCRLGMILRTADMLGAAEVASAAACDYAANRRQFGKPLSGQQIVATDLARDHYRLECVRTSVAYAAIAWDAGQVDSAQACNIASSLAADMLPTVVENAIQIHGAMGFTWDLPLHRSLRRVRTAAAIAPAAEMREALAARLLHRWAEAG
ncbi:MAG: acyl-CoA dehydrogenase family protein [Sphingobium sp.]